MNKQPHFHSGIQIIIVKGNLACSVDSCMESLSNLGPGLGLAIQPPKNHIGLATTDKTGPSLVVPLHNPKPSPRSQSPSLQPF